MVAPKENLDLPPLHKITMVVGSLEDKQDPLAAVQHDGITRVVAGAGILREVERIRATGGRAMSCALINSEGGFIRVGRLFQDPIRVLRQEMATPTTAFVDTCAESMAASILRSCYPWILRRDSNVMFHQTSLSGKTGQNGMGSRPTLSMPRHVFRDGITRWLRENVTPTQVPFALGRAHAAFRDPENHLDDVAFRGYELARMGLAQRLVRTRKQLAACYSETIGVPPEEWAEPVAEFFQGA